MECETIDKGMVKLWAGEGWFLYVQYAKPKRLKFFLVNAFTREFRVRLKEQIVYQGTDLGKAIEAYNSI